MRHRFGVGRAFGGELTSSLPAADRLGGLARFGQVVRRDLGLARHELGEAVAERRRDPGVELLALALEQAAVGGILDEGMLEAVSGIRNGPTTEHQLRA